MTEPPQRIILDGGAALPRQRSVAGWFMRANAQRRPTVSLSSLACALLLCGLVVAAGQVSKAHLTGDEPRRTGLDQPSSPPSSLAGFNCPLRLNPLSAALFTADPTYREAPPTLGLEAAYEDAQNGSGTLDVAGIGAMEAENPLSTKLFRLIVEGGDAVPLTGDEVREVSLPGASKSVADLTAFCGP